VIGDAHAFSFYPTKNLGALGDAGAVASLDKAFMKEVRLLRDHGQEIRDEHLRIGASNRLDEMQAAILAYKLNYLSEWVERRKNIGQHYISALQGHSTLRLGTLYSAQSVFHLFVVWADNPNHFMEYLEAKEIGYGRHYPHALGDLEPFKKLHQVCPNASTRASHLVSLPLFPEMTDDEVEQVCLALRHYA
jgi:dTDP-4-amino-4,6-dideoxygalactose transaminase